MCTDRWIRMMIIIIIAQRKRWSRNWQRNDVRKVSICGRLIGVEQFSTSTERHHHRRPRCEGDLSIDFVTFRGSTNTQLLPRAQWHSALNRNDTMTWQAHMLFTATPNDDHDHFYFWRWFMRAWPLLTLSNFIMPTCKYRLREGVTHGANYSSKHTWSTPAPASLSSWHNRSRFAGVSKYVLSMTKLTGGEAVLACSSRKSAEHLCMCVCTAPVVRCTRYAYLHSFRV